jgi:hypothetical protein
MPSGLPANDDTLATADTVGVLKEHRDGLLVAIEHGLDRYRQVPLFMIRSPTLEKVTRQILAGLIALCWSPRGPQS